MSDFDEDMGDDVGPPQDLSSAETADRDDDSDGGDDDFEAQSSGFVAAEVGRRGREISPRTRELLKKAAESVQTQMAAARRAEQPEEFEDEEDYAAGEAPAPAKAPPPNPVPAAAAPAAAPTVPPAPSLDPQVVQLREQWTARATELDKREQAIAAREQAADEHRVHEAYLENPAGALLDFVRKHSGIASDDEIADEVSDLIVALSAHVHKVPVDGAVKSRLDAKHALRYVKAQQAALQKREEAVSKQQSEAQQRVEIDRTKEVLTREIGKPDHAKLYPYLALEENSGEIVWEVIEAQFKRDGTTLAWTEAAKRAEEYLNNQASAWIDKRKHLLDARTENGHSGAPRDSASGDPTGIRRSRAITNAATSAAPQQPAPTAPAKWDPESHRAATKRKMRAAFAAAKADPVE